MAPTNDQVKDQLADAVTDTPEQGDTFDDDSGEFLGTLELKDGLPPAQIAVRVGHFWYVYTPISRYQDAEERLNIVAEVEAAAKEAAKDEIHAEDSILPKTTR